tara:strand:+ start:4709 stop:5668 length:960 start_codon:yes stop_codon:yes gene_type:complete
VAARKYLDLKCLNPGFVLRRLARLSTFDANEFNLAVAPEVLAQLHTVSLSAQSDFSGRELLFVFGLMPRSGTNFLFEMLLRIPGVERTRIAFDELPILVRPQAFEHVSTMIRAYHPPSADAFAPLSWLAFSAAGLRNHLLNLAPDGSLTLIKEPHPNNLSLFPSIFPKDRALVILRDGRYVVDSFARSFARSRLSRSFTEICEEYRASAETVADFLESDHANVKVVRYEQANRERAATIEDIFNWLYRPIDRTALAALEALPIYGSSVKSVANSGAVDWTPVQADASFDPSSRKLGWSAGQTRTFDRIAGAVNRRLGYE